MFILILKKTIQSECLPIKAAFWLDDFGIWGFSY